MPGRGKANGKVSEDRNPFLWCYMLLPGAMLLVLHLSGQTNWMAPQRVQRTLDVSRITASPAGIFLQPFLQSRTPGSPGSQKVQQFLLGHFARLKWHVEVDRFASPVPNSPSCQFTNLVFTQNPKAKRRIVLAAHYDSKLTVDGQDHDGQFIGATDSAWPCALMAELAFAMTHRFVAGPRFNNVSLQMIFFDGEEAQVHWTKEDSLYGSKHLAWLWSKQRDRTKTIDAIDLFVLLDLLGAARPAFYPMIQRTRPEFAQLAAVEARLRQTLALASSRPPYFNTIVPQDMSGVTVDDDHVPFLNLNVPCLHIIPLPFPTVWHTMADDESALDNQTIADLTRIMHGYIEELFRLPPVK